jgi:hypothetical protein
MLPKRDRAALRAALRFAPQLTCNRQRARSVRTATPGPCRG